jgi:hypothetical protein
MGEEMRHVPIDERVDEELDQAQRSVSRAAETYTASDEEKRNGWTDETLTAYINSRKAGQSLTTDPDSLQRRLARRPVESNHRYSPHKWRG